MPPSVDEFSEDFAEFPIATVIDYFSGYYEVGLHPKSRDMMAFMTDVGLMRMTRLPQGWTNSVSMFQQIISKVDWPLIPHNCRPFIDDCPQRTKKPVQQRGDLTCDLTICSQTLTHLSRIYEAILDGWFDDFWIQVSHRDAWDYNCPICLRQRRTASGSADNSTELQLANPLIDQSSPRIYRNLCLLPDLHQGFLPHRGPDPSAISERETIQMKR
jgi:hypothetical protein